MALRMFREYGVGDAVCKTGITLFVAIDNRKLWFITGEGIKDRVTDPHITHIHSAMKPFLRSNDVEGALSLAVRLISDVVEFGSESDVTKALPSTGFYAFLEAIIPSGIALCFVGTVAAFSLSGSRSRERSYDACRERLRTIEALNQTTNGFTDECTMCAICLEKFEEEQEPVPNVSHPH